MRLQHIIILTGLALLGLLSCTDQVKRDFMPVARGEADEIILVMDSTQWNSELGNTIQGMYQEYYRVLNQDEYKFSLNKVNPLKMNAVFENAKNLIFVMTLDSRTNQSAAMRQFFTDKSLKMIQRDESIFYTVRKDEFAKGQIVLYLFGQNEEQLIEHIKDNRESLIELFENEVRVRTREIVLKKTKMELMNAITEKHGYQIQIPFGFDLSTNQDNFVWLRQLEADSELNLFIYEEPYTEQEVFGSTDLLRDRITAEYLRDSEKPDLYIQRQEVIPVLTSRVTFDNKFAVEMRGLWKISDNSAGGPFVSFTMADEATQKLYYIEGYLYAPGKRKKPLMRELEAIISTFKTPSSIDPS